MHFLTATSSTFHLLKPLPLTSNDEREQTPNQFLVEMDGFETNKGVIIKTALNRPEILDTALLGPGRPDGQIRVDGPDINGG